MNLLTPMQIVAELDKYIIGQHEAKRAVAVALRNRYRRSQLPDSAREDITPKNIIMKGPTGVGKTEIARRLAKLVKAPFVKVEATKFTEVGYVGRDVESMIRDLVETSIRLVREERFKEVSAKATAIAQKKILQVLVQEKLRADSTLSEATVRDELMQKLRSGELDNHVVEVEVDDAPKSLEIMPGMGAEINIGDMFGNLFPKKKKRRKLSVKEAMNIFIAEESDKLIDTDTVNSEAIRRAENEGIIFIDEIDKIAGAGKGSGPDVSREGVQRDILPIVEGSTVMTKYGPIQTDYILFIAAGAFHVSKVSDLIPELQGRFPVLVELNSLSKDDFVKILSQPKNAITVQYATLLRVDNIDLKFTMDALERIAAISEEMNNTSEDIGARRLHTVMESILEDISFNAGGDYPLIEVVVDSAYVDQHIQKSMKSRDLKKYIL